MSYDKSVSDANLLRILASADSMKETLRRFYGNHETPDYYLFASNADVLSAELDELYKTVWQVNRRAKHTRLDAAESADRMDELCRAITTAFSSSDDRSLTFLAVQFSEISESLRQLAPHND